MPVDAGSAGDPGGDLAVWRDGGQAWGPLRARVLTAGERPGAGEILGRSHWGTCVNAGAARTRCEGCGHDPHALTCTRLGPLECRQVPLDMLGETITARVRGRFPCGCDVRTPPGKDESLPARRRR
jgi:hypothetical protein